MLSTTRGSGCSVRRVDAGAPYDAPTSQGVDAFPALLAAVGVPAPLTAWGKWGDMTAARRRPAEAPETVEFKERLQWDDGAGKGCMHQGGGVLADRLRWCGHSRAHESQTAREVQAGQGRPRGGQAASRHRSWSMVAEPEVPVFGCPSGSGSAFCGRATPMSMKQPFPSNVNSQY